MQWTEHALVGPDGRDLRLRVWRPADTSGAPRATLLMLDGQWLGETVEQALQNRSSSPAMIATLGFAAAERSITAPWRAHDYTPQAPDGTSQDPRVPNRTCGGAPALLKTIQDGVLPLLVSRYGADPGELTLFGHSYAGLFGIYALLCAPWQFQCVLAVSPSLWWYWPHVLTLLRTAPIWQEAGLRPALRMMIGDQERRRMKPAQPGQPREEGISTLPFAREFLAAAQALGLSDARLDVIPGQAHGPMLYWAARHCLGEFLSRSVRATP